MDPRDRRRLRYQNKRRRVQQDDHLSESESSSSHSSGSEASHSNESMNIVNIEEADIDSEDDDVGDVEEGHPGGEEGEDLQEDDNSGEGGAEHQDDENGDEDISACSDSEDEDVSADSDLEDGDYPSESEEEPGDSGDSEEENGEVSDNDGYEATDEDNDEDNYPDANTPIYPGAPISLMESLLAIFMLMSTMNVSGVLMNCILKLVALHCPDGSIVKKTLHTFKKYFKKLGDNCLVFHYYCQKCVYPLRAKNGVCRKCKKRGQASFFIEIPLLVQLQMLFKRQGFLEKLQYRFQEDRKRNQDNIEEIYDGNIYQEEMGNGGFLSFPTNISFMWYSDGVSVFKSSFFSIWPLCLVINELPYKMRTHPDNIILVGLWFGSGKPSPNIFLKPLKKTLDSFERDGHMFTNHDNRRVLVKGKMLCGTCDLPAKCKFLSFKQFNAAYGCPRCLAPGGRYPVGRTTVQVYPYQAQTETRTHQQTQEHAQQALQARVTDRKASVMGVKGPSILSQMVPDIIRCTAIDIMHGGFLGVCKWLVTLWFSSAYKTQAWSLYHLVGPLDEKLRKIKPPSFVQRTPRSLKDVKLWKAAEFKYFLLYYSIPLLKGVMEDRYLKHHCLLVAAISFLSQESISFEQIGAANAYLISYVSDFSRLYSLRFLGLTFHQLLHLPDVVRDLGPLFVYSCFFLESFNGKLNRLFHGTQHVALQICSATAMYMQIPILMERLPPGSKGLQMCQYFHGRSKSVKVGDIIDEFTYVVGSYCRKQPELAHSTDILRNTHNINGGTFYLFYRLKRKGTIFYAKEYPLKSVRKESSFVRFKKIDAEMFGQILRFVKWSRCNCQCEINCLNCETSYFVIIQEYSRQVWFAHDMQVRLPHLSKVEATGNIVAVSIQSVLSLCFYLENENEKYVANPVNLLEIE